MNYYTYLAKQTQKVDLKKGNKKSVLIVLILCILLFMVDLVFSVTFAMYCHNAASFIYEVNHHILTNKHKIASKQQINGILLAVFIVFWTLYISMSLWEVYLIFQLKKNNVANFNKTQQKLVNINPITLLIALFVPFFGLFAQSLNLWYLTFWLKK